MFDIKPTHRIRYSIEENTEYGKITFIVMKQITDCSTLPNTTETEIMFQGSVTDCYSYIKLKEGGYFNI